MFARAGSAGAVPSGAIAKKESNCGESDPKLNAAPRIEGEIMFTQLIDPLDNLTLTCLVALVPVVLLLVLLAALRLPAWLATLLGSIVTFALAVWVWKMPFDNGAHAYLYGAATGVWN